MTDIPLPPAALRLRMDAGALASNWRTLDVMSGTARAGAAVKANAYGIGAARASRVLADAGCRDFFVAHWGEAPDLLAHVPAEHIAVLHGPTTMQDADFARATRVRPVLNTLRQVHLWHESGGGPCHLMVDTGINRLGISRDELGDAAIAALDLDICLSHLASADEDVSQNAAQRLAFESVRQSVSARRYSLANSAGIALGRTYHADLTRPGLALYGGVARPELAGRIAQVAFPEAAVIQVRSLKPGDRVGYNATFIAQRPMRAGVLALGYADGYLRCWSGAGRFSWQGRDVPVLGRISMDLTIVDLTDLAECREGDWLEAVYDLPLAAKASGLSQYELLTLMGQRFAR
ncbi:alanine racemase [Novosphingobium sp. CECT 9465]|uniref:alanine racemase n=1 Tax=Novosphingobium sp. CECT 9465 TaxID=2829794 RepID=UPI001E2AD3C0|nr:alanine racemase [Novosphingobium sp. CECT 9465]CAH0496687.1 Alanine racemase 1 [Novosphingobium sp. CECT 9465]